MKTHFTIVALVFTMILGAQNPREEQIKSLRIAFLTKSLSLTPQEAQQFWPVYNEYSDRVDALHKEERRMLRSLRQQFETISEEEAQTVLNRHVTIQNNKTKAREDLITNLKGVIPAKKILILIKAEEDFKRSIFEKLKKRRQERQRQ